MKRRVPRRLYGTPRVYGVPIVHGTSGGCGCARENGKATQALITVGVIGGVSLAIFAVAHAIANRREQKYIGTITQANADRDARARKRDQVKRRRKQELRRRGRRDLEYLV